MLLHTALPRRAAVTTVALLLAACGTADDGGTTEEAAAEQSTAAAPEASPDDGAAPGDEASGASTAASANTLVVDGTEIALSTPTCTFEEQGFGGAMTSVQIETSGTGPDGGTVWLNVARFPDDPPPTGDAVDVTYGEDLLDPESTYSVLEDVGTVDIATGEGTSADGLVLRGDDGTEATVSFRVTC